MFQVPVSAHSSPIFSTTLLYWALLFIPLLLTALGISKANPRALSDVDHCTAVLSSGSSLPLTLPGTYLHVLCFQFPVPLLL